MKYYGYHSIDKMKTLQSLIDALFVQTDHVFKTVFKIFTFGFMIPYFWAIYIANKGCKEEEDQSTSEENTAPNVYCSKNNFSNFIWMVWCIIPLLIIFFGKGKKACSCRNKEIKT